MTDIKIEGQSTVGAEIEKDLGKAVKTLDELKEKAAVAFPLTSKEAAALGRASELSAGEIRKMVAAGDLEVESARKMAQAQQAAEAETKSLKESSAETSNAITGMAGAMQTAIAVFGAAKLGQTAIELYQIGAANERVAESTDKLTGGRADEYIERLTTATHGLVDDDYLLVQANEAMRTGVSQSATELGKLDEIAIAMGRDLGVGAADAVGVMTQALSAASPKQLEQLGILVKQSDLTAEVNKLLKENAGMSQSAAQQQALLNLVLRQGNDYLAKTGGLTEDAASKSEKLAVEFGNLKDRAGDLAVKIGGPLVGALNSAFDALDNMHAGFNEENDAIIRSVSSYEEYKQAVGETHDLLGAARSGLLLTEGAYLRERDAILSDNDARRESIEGHRDAQNAIQETARTEEELAQAQKDAEQAAQAHEQAIRDQYQELNNLIGIATSTGESLSTLGVQGYLASAESGKAFLDFLKAENLQFLLNGQALVDYKVKEGMLSETDAVFLAGQQEIAAFLKAYPDQINAAAAAFDNFRIGNEQAAQATLMNAESQDQYKNSVAGLYDVVHNAGTAIEETKTQGVEPLTGALAEANQALQDVGVNAAPAFDAIAKGAAPAEAQTSKLVKDFTAIKLQLTGLGDLASSAFEALAQGAGVAAAKLAITHRESAGIREDVAYLLGHSNINLNVNVNQNGGIPTGAPHAAGGPVSAGVAYPVGEQGSELFIPEQNGMILPHAQSMDLMNNSGGGGGRSGSTNIILQLDGRTIGEMLLPYIHNEANNRGMTFAPMVTTG